MNISELLSRNYGKILQYGVQNNSLDIIGRTVVGIKTELVYGQNKIHWITPFVGKV